MRHFCFSKLTVRAEVARPALRKQPGRDIAVKRRERPITHALDQAVFDGIDVTIFHMAAIVIIVADQMFPEATLPNAALAARATNLAQQLGLWNGF